MKAVRASFVLEIMARDLQRLTNLFILTLVTPTFVEKKLDGVGPSYVVIHFIFQLSFSKGEVIQMWLARLMGSLRESSFMFLVSVQYRWISGHPVQGIHCVQGTDPIKLIIVQQTLFNETLESKLVIFNTL